MSANNAAIRSQAVDTDNDHVLNRWDRSLRFRHRKGKLSTDPPRQARET